MRLAQLPRQTAHWLSHPRNIVIALASLVLVVTLLNVADPFGSDSGSDGEANLSSEAAGDAQPATQFRMASFNLLGAGHTKPGGDRPGWASGVQRMVWSVQIIRNQNLDLIGFQEMQDPQFKKFRSLTGSQYGIYPGNELGPAAMHNSIAWRRDTWERVQAKWVHIPYFHGDLIRMPYVLLRHVKTGQLAWFANFHNPANARGNARKWRIKATNIQVNLVNRLRTEYPNVPVHFAGDFNERDLYFCSLVRRTEMEAANGGYVSSGGTCRPPSPMYVDWVFGTPQTSFSGFVALRSALVRKSTDHPVIISNASIPPLPAQGSKVRLAVVLSVEGLNPGMVKRLGASRLPGMHRLMAQGASTLNARTLYLRTNQLPNALSMVTGRTETAKYGGHGQLGERDTGTTVHRTAGHYVASMFDVVHDHGGRTALFTQDPDLAMANRSWDARNGGRDIVTRDDGRDKINSFVPHRNSDVLVTALRKQLRTSPRRVSFLQLSDLDTTGHRYGWLNPRMVSAVEKVDFQLRTILYTINSDPQLKGRTMVVLTSEHGGYQKGHTDPARRAHYTVPFMVWGPGIPAGKNLYAMNPTYADPGSGRPGYGGPQPIRTGSVANVVLTALRMPAVPGSNVNRAQGLNIFVP